MFQTLTRAHPVRGPIGARSRKSGLQRDSNPRSPIEGQRFEAARFDRPGTSPCGGERTGFPQHALHSQVEADPWLSIWGIDSPVEGGGFEPSVPPERNHASGDCPV
jgi:hypothetical protein